jgi:hypothetical protein
MLNNNRYILIKVVACTRLEKVLQSAKLFKTHFFHRKNPQKNKKKKKKKI